MVDTDILRRTQAGEAKRKVNMIDSSIPTDRLAHYTQQIQQWLSMCQQNHVERCNQPGSSVLPKRLIFFDQDPNIHRLIEVDSRKKDYQYVALSYCWGPKENFKTTPRNLNEMEREIPHDRLPQTLKDVFALIRQLGYHYLWIDALCIIQDDHGMEWQSEAAKMGDVYANAVLVITALASASVHDGMFVRIEDFSEEEKLEFHKIMRTCRTMSQQDWIGLREKYPLLCRGWAFQERLLARRIVHFTVLELIWECMEDRRCRCGHEGQQQVSGKINNMNAALRECQSDPTPAKIRLMWHECVMSFSKRDLTRADDRLFAIAGIASYLRGSDPKAYEQYFEGIWKDFLPWDLIWYCDQTSALETEKARGPSYSWSSVDCGVEWPACPCASKLKHRFSLAISTGTCFESRFQDGGVIEDGCFCATATTINHPDPRLLSTLNAESGSARCATKPGLRTVTNYPYKLVIFSTLTPVIIQRQSENDTTSWRVKSLKSRNGRGVPFWPDIQLPEEEAEGKFYYYVEIASIRDGSSVRQVGLVVRPKLSADSDEQRDLYERVGLASNIICDSEKDSQPLVSSRDGRKVILI